MTNGLRITLIASLALVVIWNGVMGLLYLMA